MSKNVCQQMRDQLHAFRAGELTPVGRARVEHHLQGCRSCAADAWLQMELENAAKEGPAPLSDRSKRDILDAVHAEVGPSDRTTTTRRWPRLLVPGLATAAAAATLLLVTITPEPPPETTSGWITRQDGVEAFAPAPARATLVTEDRGPTLRVDHGAVLVHFQRQAGEQPLRVATPHAEVLVRGTVFSVDTRDDSTRVCVERGRVEVRAGNGAVAMLERGARVTVNESGLERGSCDPDQTTLMERTFGGPAPEPPEPPDLPEPAEPTPEAAPSTVTAPIAEPVRAPTPPAPATVIDEARTRWRAGQTQEALADLDTLLRTPSLDPAARVEVLYLMATIHRAGGQFATAAALLERVAREATESTGRLARLERIRILAHNLGDRRAALAELDLFLADSQSDAVADEASFERCALLLEEHQLPRGRACLNEHLQRFPESGRLREARQLLESLVP